MKKEQAIRKDEGSTQETEMQPEEMKDVTTELRAFSTDNEFFTLDVWNNGETDIGLHHARDVKISKWRYLQSKEGRKFKVKSVQVVNKNGTYTSFNIFKDVEEDGN